MKPNENQPTDQVNPIHVHELELENVCKCGYRPPQFHPAPPAPSPVEGEWTVAKEGNIVMLCFGSPNAYVSQNGIKGTDFFKSVADAHNSSIRSLSAQLFESERANADGQIFADDFENQILKLRTELASALDKIKELNAALQDALKIIEEKDKALATAVHNIDNPMARGQLLNEVLKHALALNPKTK